MKMLLNINPLKSFLTSIFSAIAGTSFDYFAQIESNIALSTANTAFQHAAWTIAILAGLVSAINGIVNLCERVKKWRAKP